MADETKALTRDEICGISDLRTERVDIPEWGGRHVFVRMMSGLEKVAFEDSLPSDEVELSGKQGLEFYAKLVTRVTVDDGGTPVFDSESNADAEMLCGKAVTALMRIAMAAAKLNGMEAKELEEMTKNLKETAASDSE